MPTPSHELEITTLAVNDLLQQGVAFRLLDVRTTGERALAAIEPSTLLTETLAREIVDTWPRHTSIVLYCHTGIRSLAAARFLQDQAGFLNARSMAGGISAARNPSSRASVSRRHAIGPVNSV